MYAHIQNGQRRTQRNKWTEQTEMRLDEWRGKQDDEKQQQNIQQMNNQTANQQNEQPKLPQGPWGSGQFASCWRVHVSINIWTTNRRNNTHSDWQVAPFMPTFNEFSELWKQLWFDI